MDNDITWFSQREVEYIVHKWEQLEAASTLLHGGLMCGSMRGRWDKHMEERRK